ncbi:MAG: 30S ribosomal protein S8 [Verrucomicrobia bacterium]|nr:30S ribosomal protein S8 [Verrucomicrobiota bacterium]MBI3869473.1 30S ribosomal protein S8 [Verrucomicrobiota bacterium]
MTDTISDLLTRIRNAHRALLTELTLPHSKMKESIAAILKREGYIVAYSVEGKPLKKLKIQLKYEGRRAVITGLRRVSSPGLRRYVASTEIPRVRGGLGTAIVSTSHGVMSGNEARQKNVGGELLCFVW